MMKNILILEHLDRGTIHTTIKINGYEAKTKILKSGVSNWQSICGILKEDKDKELLIMGKFTEYVLFIFNLPEYKVVSKELLELIKERKHIIFIYHNNFFKDFSCTKKEVWDESILEVNDEDDFIGYKRVNTLEKWLHDYEVESSSENYIERVKVFIGELNDSGYNIVPYRKLIDVEIAGQNFIESVDQGLLFQIYIPNKRIWSNEFDKFIILFRDFASNVTSEEVKVIQGRTDRGINFSIYSKSKKISSENIEELFNEFAKFLDTCVQNPVSAIKIIEETTNVPKESIPSLIQKYSKEGKRLMVDLKQERERKLLIIKHQLQTDISEIEIGVDLSELLNQTLPQLNSPSDLLSNGSRTKNQTVIINNQQYINKVEGIVSREIYGNIDFTYADKKLNEVIEEYAEDKAELTLLKSAHNEMKDKGLPQSKKTVAWQKLQKFLSKVSEKVGDVGVHLLKKYLEGELDL